MEGIGNEASDWSDAFEAEKEVVFIDPPLIMLIEGDLSYSVSHAFLGVLSSFLQTIPVSDWIHSLSDAILVVLTSILFTPAI